MKTIRLEGAESPKVLAARCISVHENGGACPVGEGFRCPFHETYCTSVAPWMWEEVMEEESTPAEEKRLRLLYAMLIDVQDASGLWEDYLAACGYIDDASDRRGITSRLHELETALQDAVAEERETVDS